MRSAQDTIAAIATPAGEGGIGVVRVSGPSALSVVKPLFQPVKPVDLATVPSHTCHFGALVDCENPSLWKREVGRDFAARQIPPDPPLSKGGKLIDQVIV